MRKWTGGAHVHCGGLHSDLQCALIYTVIKCGFSKTRSRCFIHQIMSHNVFYVTVGAKRERGEWGERVQREIGEIVKSRFYILHIKTLCTGVQPVKPTVMCKILAVGLSNRFDGEP